MGLVNSSPIPSLISEKDAGAPSSPASIAARRVPCTSRHVPASLISYAAENLNHNNLFYPLLVFIRVEKVLPFASSMNGC